MSQLILDPSQQLLSCGDDQLTFPQACRAFDHFLQQVYQIKY